MTVPATYADLLRAVGQLLDEHQARRVELHVVSAAFLVSFESRSAARSGPKQDRLVQPHAAS